ncbi:MAG: DUF2442 domain-containing protein [Fibrobacter sp.]|nr:DUF2442 domain-containing protein [Fibrobacter sp.]
MVGEVEKLPPKCSVKNDHRPIVQQLSNLDLFKDFKVQAHTIVWSNGVDFAPEFIKSLT